MGVDTLSEQGVVTLSKNDFFKKNQNDSRQLHIIVFVLDYSEGFGAGGGGGNILFC